MPCCRPALALLALAGCGDWTTMLDLPGLTELVFPWSPDGYVRGGAISTRPRLRLGTYGAPKDLPVDGRIEAIELRP